MQDNGFDRLLEESDLLITIPIFHISSTILRPIKKAVIILIKVMKQSNSNEGLQVNH
jgi:hypothetical protein